MSPLLNLLIGFDNIDIMEFTTCMYTSVMFPEMWIAQCNLSICLGKDTTLILMSASQILALNHHAEVRSSQVRSHTFPWLRAGARRSTRYLVQKRNLKANLKATWRQ